MGWKNGMIWTFSLSIAQDSMIQGVFFSKGPTQKICDMSLAIYVQCEYWNFLFHTGCFFKGPTQKSSKYEIGPTQQDKMAKYTGPTQSYQMSELLTNKWQA